MPRIDNILDISTADQFETAAMDVFRFQSENCPPYRDYLKAADIAAERINRSADIPFLPIELFKSHRVYGGRAEPEAVFTSSSSGGEGESKHYVASLVEYERVYTKGFELFYGDPSEWSIYALLPSYLQREGSSLVRMVDGLIKKGRGGGFYLYDHTKLMADIRSESGKKILLGVTYALLDLAEDGNKLPDGTIVMETGGMKGRRKEMPKEQMHKVLMNAFGVDTIHSEYGMAELMSQAYSLGNGIFRTPPWMKISMRDINDPFDVFDVGRGAINITDLANLNSCSFIQTQDLGNLTSEGSFSVIGRARRSEIRGCNLLVQ